MRARRVGQTLLWTSLTASAVGMAMFGASTPGHSGQFTLGQSRYYEFCGGCHGLSGVSARQHIPVLRGEVGRFLCTADGRRYIVRLPNVAFAAMDDQTLAETMNFMVFTLGEGSAPKGAAPYTAREVAQLRKLPLKATDLMTMRRHILDEPSKSCPA